MYPFCNLRAVPALIACAVGALLCAGIAHAEENTSVEYRVKAGYLLNFTKFVEWPINKFKTAADPIKVAVLGKDPFGPDLERTIADRVIDGRKFDIVRVDEPAAAATCHIAFVSSSERRRFPEIIDTLHKANVLTVGEHEQFVQQGGIVRFFLDENAVRSESAIRFEINLQGAEKAGLRISSKLMQIAKPPEQP